MPRIASPTTGPTLRKVAAHRACRGAGRGSGRVPAGPGAAGAPAAGLPAAGSGPCSAGCGPRWSTRSGSRMPSAIAARYSEGAGPEHPARAAGSAAGDERQPGRGGRAQGRGDQRRERDPRVGRHQRDLGREQSRGHRAPGDPVGLLQHQHPERRREQGQRVIVHGRAGHAPAEQATGQQGADHDVPAAVPDPVQHRPDERGQHGERCHRDEQGERDPAPGLVHRGAEEQRAGQGHGHERIRRRAGRGQLDEPVQAGAGSPGGLRHPADAPSRATGGGGAGPPG